MNEANIPTRKPNRSRDRFFWQKWYCQVIRMSSVAESGCRWPWLAARRFQENRSGIAGIE
jgi:hypothetical protein